MADNKNRFQGSIAGNAGLAALALAGVLSLAACSSTGTGVAPENMNETHPIQVAREQVSITISIPANGMRLSRDDDRRFRDFLRDYVQRGRSNITVETAIPNEAGAILSANGLNPGEMVFVPGTTAPAPNAILSFTANSAVVPECGKWSDSTAFQPSNEPFENFGCATRRNMGLSVSDPGDLIQSQPMSGKNAYKGDNAITTYSTSTGGTGTNAASSVAQ